jgi:hypothetical protein
MRDEGIHASRRRFDLHQSFDHRVRTSFLLGREPIWRSIGIDQAARRLRAGYACSVREFQSRRVAGAAGSPPGQGCGTRPRSMVSGCGLPRRVKKITQ